MFDFVACTTKNYQILTDIWQKTLSEVPIQKRIHLKVDDDDFNYAYYSKSYYECITRKIKNLKSFEPDEHTEFIVLSDCDIQFFKDGDWDGLVNFVRRSKRKIFFMRDCTKPLVNAGFYIIKKDYFDEYKKFLDGMLQRNLDDYLFGDQCYINENLDQLDWDYISEKYITGFVTMNSEYDLSKLCAHHAIWHCEQDKDKGIMAKVKTIQRMKGLVKHEVPDYMKIRGDYMLVISIDGDENIAWSKKYENRKVYTGSPYPVDYLSYIIENYERLPSKIYFSRGSEKFDEIETSMVNEFKYSIYYPTEKIDIVTWFKKFINDSINLEEKVTFFKDATFCVTREQILSKSKEYYQTLRFLIPKTKNPEIIRYFDKSWFYIFL